MRTWPSSRTTRSGRARAWTSRSSRTSTKASLYRLRVGEHRAAYLVVSEDRTVTVLVIEDREVGYKRIIARAMARMRG
jgi:hypothetical protein